MPPNGALPQTLYLPPKVIALMIKVLPDYLVPHVWKLRFVCKSWKAEVEKAFREEYLPKTSIRLFQSADLGGLVATHRLSLEFHRFSEGDNAAHAIFRPGLLSDRTGSLDLVQLMARLSPTAHGTLVNVVHKVTMENIATGDPALEGFGVDRVAQEVYFLWKPMVSQLMGDEIRLRRRTFQLVEAANLTGSSTQQVTNRYGIRVPQQVTLELQLWAVQRDKAFINVISEVRESRIRKQYENCGVQFQSLPAHDGSPFLTAEVNESVWWTRIHFRSPAQYTEL
ncbi:hypothetical protein F5Y13DRAFT_190342 [Hypoxylon sp. FL1857]|nr:hypothetical protein F5Y13DRAFT_190342 [Hypoxylon sp. FL1857]